MARLSLREHDIVENWGKEDLENHEKISDLIIHSVQRITRLRNRYNWARHKYPKFITARTVKKFIDDELEMEIENMGETFSSTSVHYIRDVMKMYFRDTDMLEKGEPTEDTKSICKGPLPEEYYGYSYRSVEEVEESKTRRDSIRQKMIDMGITEI